MSLLNQLFASKTRAPRAEAARRRKARPEVEPLEDRLLLAIFGYDDRLFVTNTTAYPWRAVGRLAIHFPDGINLMGTGALIDPRHVLTVGHCVYDADHGGWATSITFSPGQSGSYKPYGTANMTYMRTYTGWTQNENYDYDMALITLDQNIGNSTGWFGTQVQSDSFFQGGYVNTAGYPGDRSLYGVDMYFASGPISYGTTNRFFFNGTLDDAGGQSGSPMWTYDSSTGSRYIVGVLNTTGTYYNGGVRLTSSRFNDLYNWIWQDGGTFAGAGLAPANLGAGTAGMPATGDGLPPPDATAALAEQYADAPPGDPAAPGDPSTIDPALAGQAPLVTVTPAPPVTVTPAPPVTVTPQVLPPHRRHRRAHCRRHGRHGLLRRNLHRRLAHKVVAAQYFAAAQGPQAVVATTLDQDVQRSDFTTDAADELEPAAVDQVFETAGDDGV